MSDKDDGGVAFPFAFNHPDVGPQVVPGMSYRAWAAGQAMPGILSVLGINPRQVAEMAVLCADALIREMKK